ncbi:SiaB family protein kinase [Mesoterricola sediminis]|uniref:Uncharacterized protein n=1 Tax=Mesoterricola sediminis TaxID=2927980 RepID=A0AA48GZ08_9BACT|nr:SiaB family protein kinase [Mesoterricola sediminis]BDU78235.1 hypothetical protein METESE_31930 [Mesoterricola sediminis]
MSDLHAIHQYLAGDGILMCFNGPFRHSLIEELGKAVRRHLECEAVAKPAMADVFTVFIEAAQNVANYANRPLWDEATRSRVQHGVLVIARHEDRYVVRCGNLVHPADGLALMARLDDLAALDQKALKARFKAQIHAGGSAAGGAGLGLIRMARTASLPLEYRLVSGDGGLDFFSLTVTL